MYSEAWGQDDGTEPEGDDRLWWYPPRDKDAEVSKGWIYKCMKCEVTWRDGYDKRVSCWACGRFIKKRTTV